MDLNGADLSVQAIWDPIAGEKAAEAAKHDAAAAAQAKQEKARQTFSKREVQPEAIDRFATVIRRAVANGEKQAAVMQFPSNWLEDQGRSITNRDPNWHTKLTGFPQRAYAFYEKEFAPRGSQPKVEISNWPGNVGRYLPCARTEAG